MIAIDTSALVAVLCDEPERRLFNEIIEKSATTVISVASLLEVRIVLYARAGDAAIMALDAFLHKADIDTIEVSEEMAEIAFAAYRRYGKGTGHPAALNYGDCFSYALAVHKDIPLLFKGRDFERTDIVAATA